LGHSSITVALDCHGHCFPSMATSPADALATLAAEGEQVAKVVQLR
jgi:hypothetical protein